MKIEVTQSHIDHGEPHTLNRCAVALALRSQVDDMIRVGFWELKVISTKDMTVQPVWKWPTKVQQFISDFDGGLVVKPMNFTLPDSVVKRIKELGGDDVKKETKLGRKTVQRSNRPGKRPGRVERPN